MNDFEKRFYEMEAALKWIRFKANLHYIGDAFDPEHMREIANLAANTLAGNKPQLPDFDEAMEKAKAEGARMAAWFRETGASG